MNVLEEFYVYYCWTLRLRKTELLYMFQYFFKLKIFGVFTDASFGFFFVSDSKMVSFCIATAANLV